MAEWLKRRNKIKSVFWLLKDQTAAGLARASGSFSPLQFAVVMATSHDECLPEEKYVEEILATGSGSRLKVSYCVRALVKRLYKTQNWAVAIKCLVVIHRSILDGGFLFQDQLSFCSNKGGRGYLNCMNFRDDLDPLTWELSSWVKLYAKYLDERLICTRLMKSHLDSKWKSESIQGRVCYMATVQLLDDIVALQNVLHVLCQSEVGPEAGKNSVIQGALILVVSDSYKVQEEIRFRLLEMLDRVGNLQLSEGLQLLQICKKAVRQMEELVKFLKSCKVLSLLSDVPLPDKVLVSESDMEKLNEAIKTPIMPLYMKRSVSSGGRARGGRSGFLERTGSGSYKREGHGMIQRTTSQPMSQPRWLQKQVNEQFTGESPYSDSQLQKNLPPQSTSCSDLIDLSQDTTLPSVGEGPELPTSSSGMTQDLISWVPPERTREVNKSTEWEQTLLESMTSLSVGPSQTSYGSTYGTTASSITLTHPPWLDEAMYRMQGEVNRENTNKVDSPRPRLMEHTPAAHDLRTVPSHYAHSNLWPTKRSGVTTSLP